MQKPRLGGNRGPRSSNCRCHHASASARLCPYAGHQQACAKPCAELGLGALHLARLVDPASALVVTAAVASAALDGTASDWTVKAVCSGLHATSPATQRGCAVTAGRLAFAGVLGLGMAFSGAPSDNAAMQEQWADLVVRALRRALQSSDLAAVRCVCLDALSNVGKRLPRASMVQHCRGILHMATYVVTECASVLLRSHGHSEPPFLPAEAARPATATGSGRDIVMGAVCVEGAEMKATRAGAGAWKRLQRGRGRDRSRSQARPGGVGAGTAPLTATVGMTDTGGISRGVAGLSSAGREEARAACECIEVWLRLTLPQPGDEGSMADRPLPSRLGSSPAAEASAFVQGASRALLVALRVIARHAGVGRVQLAALYTARALEVTGWVQDEDLEVVNGTPAASSVRDCAADVSLPREAPDLCSEQYGTGTASEARRSARDAGSAVGAQQGAELRLGAPSAGAGAPLPASGSTSRREPLPRPVRGESANTHSGTAAGDSEVLRKPRGRDARAASNDDDAGAASLQHADGATEGSDPLYETLEAVSSPGVTFAAAALATGADCLQWVLAQGTEAMTAHAGLPWPVRVALQTTDGIDAWKLTWTARGEWVGALAAGLRWSVVGAKSGDAEAAADAGLAVQWTLALLGSAPSLPSRGSCSAREGDRQRVALAALRTGTALPRLAPTVAERLASPAAIATLRAALAEAAALPRDSTDRLAESVAEAAATGREALARSRAARALVASISSRAALCLQALDA